MKEKEYKGYRSIQRKEKPNQNPANNEFPKDEDGVIYVRQSSLAQLQKNIHSFEMQTDKFLEHFRNMGCTGNIEIVADDEAMSGTLDIHQLPGLSRVMRMIKQKKIRWIGAVHVNRLTRDPDLVKPTLLMKECRLHDVWIATLRMHFNFNDPSGYSQRVFMIEAEESARHLEWMKLVLGGGKSVASDNGYYDGRWLVPGYIVDRTDPKRKKYIIYQPHAEVIKWMFKRFFELDGNLWALCREIDQKPYLFPMFDDWVDPLNTRKFPGNRKRGGSLIKDGPYKGNYKPTDHGIISILTNPIYIGWWLPLDGGVVENNHDAIVEEWQFTYAHKRLSTHDLNGERQKPERVTRNGKAQALLKKVAHDEEGNRVYAMVEKGWSYIRCEDRGLSMKYTYFHQVKVIDAVFVDKLKERLASGDFPMFDAWEDIVEEKLAAKKELEESIQKHIIEAELQRQETMDILDDRRIPKTTQMKIDYAKKVAGLETKIASWQKELAALVEPDEEEEEEAILYEISTLLPGIIQEWDNLRFDTRLRFVGALVRRVVFRHVSPNLLKMSILWKIPSWGMDMGHIRRESRPGWSEEEEEIIRKLYPSADAAEILEALPNRSWKGVLTRARVLGIKRINRNSQRNSIPANEIVFATSTKEDREYAEQHSIDLSSKKMQWLI